jgi:hypothetical protein
MRIPFNYFPNSLFAGLWPFLSLRGRVRSSTQSAKKR